MGVFRTHPEAPRVLISNSMLVPAWATWEHFYELDRKGLMMYGQMTAGSWIYIGTQGILQGTYETFAEAARQHFGGSLKGRLVLTAGLGGMGGAQPLAATMNEGVMIAVEVDRQRIERRLETRYLDVMAETVDEALARARGGARRRGGPLSIGLLGNAADVLPELVRRGVVPDLVTDQTSAHDPLNGYVPNRMSYEEALALRRADPARYMAEARREHGRARAGDARPEGSRLGRVRLRQQHPGRGPEGRGRERLRLPRLRARLHPAPLLRGQGARSAGPASPATPRTCERPTRRSSRRSRRIARSPGGSPSPASA